MILSEQDKAANAKANQIWRFYADAEQKWRWERLTFDGTVLAQSKSGYADYEGCLANATKAGHVQMPALSTKAPSRPSKSKRSYVRLASIVR